MKRYRCPDCGAVHTMRPDSYVEGVRYPVAVILFCLFVRAVSNRWAPDIAYQLQQAWWKTLLKLASVKSNWPCLRLKTLIIGVCMWSVFREVLLL